MAKYVTYVTGSSQQSEEFKKLKEAFTKEAGARLVVEECIDLLAALWDMSAMNYGDNYPVRIFICRDDAYYRSDFSGYTMDGLVAGIYTLKEAVEHCNSRTSDRMIVVPCNPLEVCRIIDWIEEEKP